jgi:AcrR family transcriptional regulator
MATGSGSLRDRKKAATRKALIDAAERLFEERGFDAVTVAEIADAANVSVKTMFVYFRSREDLVFADNALIESLVAAVRDRPAGSAPADEIVRVVTSAIDPAHVPEGLEVSPRVRAVARAGVGAPAAVGRLREPVDGRAGRLRPGHTADAGARHAAGRHRAPDDVGRGAPRSHRPQPQRGSRRARSR